MKIFISYSTKIEKVSQFAKELKAELKHEPGVAEVFICEEDIPFGEVWGQYIATKLNNCHAFIPIITQEYLDSRPCHQEIQDACYTYKKPIFPILIEDCKLDYKNSNYGLAIQAIVREVQYITFKTTKVEHPVYDNLLAAIKQMVLGVRVPIQVTQGQSTVETSKGPSSGTMAEDSIPSIPNHIMDGNPEILELTRYVQTAKWNELGIELKINEVILAGCNSCAQMYQKWLATKPKCETTRRKLIAALEATFEVALAEQYRKHLTTMISINN